MAKQTFTTGQVLTAAQMTSLQQTAMMGGEASAKVASYTLVAADAGTAISMSNASATTITVNTALFAAGDTVQITNLGAGVCTITAGTATVNTASSLALAQYESGTLDFTSTSAAVFIKGAGVAAGAFTSIASGTLSTASVVLSSIAQTYNDLILVVNNPYITAGSGVGLVRVNGSTSYLYGRTIINSNNTQETDGVTVLDYIRSIPLSTNTTKYGQVIVRFKNYTSTTSLKLFDYQEFENINSPARLKTGIGGFASQSAITSITFGTDSSTFAGGTYVLYGVK